MRDKPFYSMFEQICRSHGWDLGQDKGEVVLGVPQDGEQQSLVINEFQDTTGQYALRLWSPVAPAARVPADQALQINHQLPHGAFATDQEGRVVLLATRVFNMTNQSELTLLVTTLTYYAAFYRKHYGG